MDDLDRFYAGKHAEHKAWMQRRDAVERGWMRLLLPVLKKGPALTAALAQAAGVKSGLEYSRFVACLKKNCKSIGVETGASKHPNKIWILN